MICKKCKGDKDESEFPMASATSKYYRKKDGGTSVRKYTYRRSCCQDCYRMQQYESQNRI